MVEYYQPINKLNKLANSFDLCFHDQTVLEIYMTKNRNYSMSLEFSSKKKFTKLIDTIVTILDVNFIFEIQYNNNNYKTKKKLKKGLHLNIK